MSAHSEEIWSEMERIDQRIARVKMLIRHQGSIVDRKQRTGVSIAESEFLLEQLQDSLSLLEILREQVVQQGQLRPRDSQAVHTRK